MKKTDIADIRHIVQHALNEDIGSGDITAALIDTNAPAQAIIITRSPGILCGIEWANQCFQHLDTQCRIQWLYSDGDYISAGDKLCQLQGTAGSLLTAERTALNFLQTLSGTATLTQRYSEAIAHTQTQLVDTRKTIPNLRHAQKYAVRCGGGSNHRMGLYDAILIKENHIKACGSIQAAITQARQLTDNKIVEIEVENIQEFTQALKAHPDIILLDNFTVDDIAQAVRNNSAHITLEASGTITLDNIRQIAETGIDRIAVGALTKTVQPLDFTLLFTA